ncbi:MAG: serine/threonine protein kinase [Eggerthellaceae bacterium]|jgi:serine/threonine protein kinase|nr:serine/threonine protein kinase [Eggerthellaceae bacterium]MDR2715981.1 serine/threonine protein kinase [Coriobacteriaceae bacterium]
MQDHLILNRFRLIAEAGSGGFSTVQLAWDPRMQRRVAIKCFPLGEDDRTQMDAATFGYPGGYPGEGYQESQSYLPHSLEGIPGLREARTDALFTDSAIVEAYDFVVQGSTAYLIMEYVDGLTLAELLQAYDGELSLDVVATIFSSVAQALKVAHENRVLHLDIKPSNVLISRQGQVKVADFGLATLAGSTGFGAASGGTIGYMPPEQMRQESLDVRCDEWALASITYEMLTGKNPFIVRDFSQAEAAIVNAELVLPSLCIDGLSAEADDVLFYALDPDRKARYSSVADFAEEMGRFLGDQVEGKHELALLVEQACEDFGDGFPEDAERHPVYLDFFDRMSRRSKGIASRVWGALNTAALGFVALSSMPQIDGWASPLFWGILALLVVTAAIKPHLGAILGLLALVVALFANNAPLLGLVLLSLSLLWWLFIGRMGDSQANSATAPALFGGAGFNQMSPLLVGFLLNTKDAVANIVFALVLSMVLAGFGSGSLLGWNTVGFWDFAGTGIQDRVWDLLVQPSTWCVIASWFLAAAAVRLLCLRRTRFLAAVGILLGTAVLVGGLCQGAWLDSGYASWMPDSLALGLTIGAGAIMTVTCVLGVPPRENEAQEEGPQTPLSQSGEI